MTGLHFDITGDNSNFLRKLDEARNGVRSTSKQIEESGVSIEQMFGRLTNGVAAFGAGITAKEIVSSIVRVRGEFQQLEVAFNTMLGSEQKATSLMQQLVKTAATTPFDLQSVAKGAKQLLAYGTNAENVNDELITLGNVAAGISVPLGDLVYLYGTLRSQGRAYSVDIKQFAGRGIPIYAELAKVMGVNVEKVNALIEAGKVGFPQVEQAFKNMTSAGGMFNNLMQEQSKTITGQISNIGDSISMMYNNIGKSSEGMINDALSDVSYLVENYEKVGKTIMELAATYGAYKAVLISVAAYQSFAVGVTYSTEIAELSKLIPLKQQSANQDVLAAVTSGKLTQSKAEQVIALRAEIAAKIQSLQATKLQAQADFSSALASYKAARLRYTVAQEQVALAQSQMSIAIKSGTVEEIAAAKKNAQTASLELNNAAISKNTAHKGVNIAATNSKSASEALNTVQTGLNTVSQNTNTISTNILTVAKTKLAAASKALGLSMLANPYVLVAAAVAGLAYGIYKLATAETEVEEATRATNEALEAQKKHYDDLKSKSSELSGILTNESKSIEERFIAYRQLQRLMPSIFKDMDFETAKRLSNTDAIKLETAEILRQQRIGLKTKVVMSEQKIQGLRKSMTKTENNGGYTGALKEDLDAAQKELEIYQEALKDLEDAKKESEKSKNKPVENKTLKQLLIDIDTAKMKLKSLQEQANKGLISSDKVKEQSDALSKLTADYKQRTGKEYGSTKQESAAEKLRKEQEQYNLLLDKQKREEARMKTDSQHELEQIEINGLVEGSEKVLRQRALNHDKEIETIKREAQEKKAKAIEAARDAHESNPDKKKGIFDADKFVKSEPAQKQFAIFDKTAEAKTKTENTKYNRGDDFKGLLNEYQDYTDKRLAIETKYNNDLAVLDEQRKQAVKNGDTQQVEQIDRAKAQATKNKGMELMGMDYDKLKESPDYVRAFENLKETSSETLNSLLSQLENAKSTAAKVLSPDQLREYTTTIQEIMDELDSRNPFQSLSDKKQELAEAEQELADAQLALENARQTADAVKGGAQIENGVKSSKFNEKTGKIDSSKAYLTEAQALEKVKEKTDKYNKAKDNVVKTDAKVKKAEKDVKGQIDELANAMSDLGNSIGGQAGEIISLIGDIGSFTMFAMEGVKAAADTSATAISTVEKASVILAIISAAVQVATKIAKLFKGESDEEKRKKELEHYNKIIAIYDKIIEKQKDSIKFGYGFASIEAAKKAMEGLNAQTEQYRNIARSNATNIMFKPENLTAYRKALADLGIQADLGDLFKTDELSNLSSKQLEYIRDNYKDLWASLRNEERDALQAIIDAEEKGKEITDEWKEAITGVSYDSFYNEFIDTLSDMDSSAEDMANNFGEYLKKSILAAMVAKEFQGKIDNLYEMWAAAGKEESDGGIDITKQEAEDLQKRQKELTEAMIKRREEMEKTYGWESSSSQDSTKSGFESMSQDTGNELNGRFTALQISNEEIKNSMLSMLVSVNFISVSVGSNGITLTEIRNLMISSNSYLEDIAKYTKELIGFKQTISNIETSAKAMAGK